MAGLRRRTLFSLGFVVVAALGASVTIAEVAIRRTVEEERRRELAERAEAAEHWLETTAHSLRGSVRDYARWDDTYAFVRGEVPDYEEVGFTLESWKNLDLDVVLIGVPDRLVVAEEATREGEEVTRRPVRAAWAAAFTPLLAQRDVPVGLVALDGDVWLYALEPVTKSDLTGADGTMWFAARRLDADRLSSAQQLAGGTLRLLPPGAVAPPAAEAGVEVGETALGLGTGFSGWTVRLEREATIDRVVRSQLTIVATNTAIPGVVLLVAALVLIDRLVLARLARLAEQAARIRAGAADLRLTVSGSDELDRLAAAVNDLLDADGANRERLRHEVLHDPLTGLANRSLLLDRLGNALARAGRSGEVRCALLFLDLDRMKRINDHLGHDAGDRFIAEVARRLGNQVRASDTVARLGGDEFAVLLEDVHSFDVAVSRTLALLTAVRMPYAEGGQSYDLTASVGITVVRPNSTVTSLLKEADTAMYAAKQAGRDGWSIYDEAMHGRVTGRLATERALRAALKTEAFAVHFQPVVNVGTGELVGFEALARWTDPDRGPISPDEFIAVAEDGPLIAELDAEVLGRALRHFAPWARQRPGLFLCLNHSARRFESSELIPEIAAALAAHDLPGSALVLEVTETQFGKSEDRWSERIATLASLGVRVALDDFGTGYSSLARLRSVPVAMLKLDRTFVEDLVNGNEAVANAILQLSEALSFPVIAEGIESAAAAARLAELGCAYGQGWHFGRPVPAGEAGKLVARA